MFFYYGISFLVWILKAGGGYNKGTKGDRNSRKDEGYGN